MTTILEALKEAHSKATPKMRAQAFLYDDGLSDDDNWMLAGEDGGLAWDMSRQDAEFCALSRTHLGTLIEAAEALARMGSMLSVKAGTWDDLQMAAWQNNVIEARAILSRLQEPSQ